VLRASKQGVAAARAGHVEPGITRKHRLANSLCLMHAGAATTVTGSADLPIPKRGSAKAHELQLECSPERALAGLAGGLSWAVLSGAVCMVLYSTCSGSVQNRDLVNKISLAVDCRRRTGESKSRALHADVALQAACWTYS
jgi:hypothetical protein